MALACGYCSQGATQKAVCWVRERETRGGEEQGTGVHGRKGFPATQTALAPTRTEIEATEVSGDPTIV